MRPAGAAASTFSISAHKERAKMRVEHMANLIERFDSISRECDGLMTQIEAERANPTRSLRMNGRGVIYVPNITKLAQLETLLAERQRELERLDHGATALMRTSPAVFFVGIENSRASARFMAARR